MKGYGKNNWIKAFVILLILVNICCGFAWAKVSKSAKGGKQADSSIVTKCKADLASRFKLQVQNIKLIESKPTIWPDASLGMSKPGEVYAQVLTPGFRIVLQAKNSRYLYTTSSNAIRYGGPIYCWKYSMLYTKPVKDEPNLNGDLYQCSLMGTNSVLLVSGVADYYPQENGVVLATRRTSRSSHELLYVKADKVVITRKIYSAFSFGDVTLNSSQDEWAGFVKPMVGSAWTIVIAQIDTKNKDAKVLDLPEGVRPDRIAWSGETLMVLVKKGELTFCYETDPKADTPVWKQAPNYTFSGLMSFMLNKSETLEISQFTTQGDADVEVSRVWFTGDRKVVAKIKDFTLQGYDLLGGFAFIWGEKNSKPTAYAVDIYTGEVINTFSGNSRSLKPFQYPLQNNPIVIEKAK